jgi:hypothetical protein
VPVPFSSFGALFFSPFGAGRCLSSELSETILLEANAYLAANSKANSSRDAIDLDEGAEIRILVPEKWLVHRFGRTHAELNK